MVEEVERTAAYCNRTVTIMGFPALAYIPWLIMLPFWAYLFSPRYIMLATCYSVTVSLMFKLKVTTFGLQVKFWTFLNSGKVNIKPKRLKY